MKTLFRLPAFLVLATFAFSQTANVTKTPGTDAIKEDLVIGAGRTLTLSGNTTGTPTGGTLSLANLTLTLPSSFTWAGTLAVANGGTGVTTSTGTGSVVRATSPTLVTPLLGTPTSGVATNLTGLPLTTGVTGTLPVANGGTGVTTSTGSGNTVLSTSPTLVTPTLGAATATSLTLSGNISAPAWTTTGVRVKGVTATLTDTTSTGTVAAAYTDVLGGNTIAASNATTYTDYITAFFKEPTAGSLVTMTNKWALGGESLRIGTSTPMTVSTAGAITANSLTGRASTDLALTGGSTGASLVLGATTSGVATFNRGVTVSAANAAGASTRLSATNTSSAGYSDGFWFNDLGAYGGFQVAGSAVAGTKYGLNRAGNTFLIANNSLGIGTDSASPVTFAINGTESARLTTTGNLLIGTTTDAANLSGGLIVNGSGTAAAATSAATGALRVTGGIGINGNGYFGGNLSAGTGSTGYVYLGSTFHYIRGGSGIKTIIAGSSNGVEIESNSNFNVTNTTSASSSTVGALTIGNGSAATNVAIGAGGIWAGTSVRGGTATDYIAMSSGGLRTVNSTDSAAIKNGVIIEGVVSSGSTLPALLWYGTGLATIAQIYPQRTAGSFASSLFLQTSQAGGTLATGIEISTAQEVKIPSTLASTGSTSGALQVAGGIYSGAASVFGGVTTFTSAAGSVYPLVSTTAADSIAYIAFTPQTGTGRSFSVGVGGPGATVDSSALQNKWFIRNNSTSTRPLIIDGTTDAATFSGAVTASGHFTASSSANIGGGTSLIALSGSNSVSAGLPTAWTGAYGLGVTYASAVSTIYYGDGTGYSLDFKTRSGGVNTSRMTLTDAGALTVTGDVSVGGSNGLSITKGTATVRSIVAGGSNELYQVFPNTGTTTSMSFGMGSNSATAPYINTTASLTSIYGAGGTLGLTVGASGAVAAKGTATNDNAATGYIGEYVSSLVATGSAVALTASGTAYNVTSISLTAGDWDVEANASYNMTGTTGTLKFAGVSTTSATFGGPETYALKLNATTTTTNTDGLVSPLVRVSLSATTTVYMVARHDFSAGTVSAFGSIRARRVR